MFYFDHNLRDAMTKLSVNINKLALIRNSRGGNNPDLVNWAINCEKYGAQGITVHPRPDERHVRYADVFELKKIVTTELNIEGNPKEAKFIDLVLQTKPHQVTLVPDAGNQLTSDHGWDTIKEANFLKEMIALFSKEGIRTSIFVDPNSEMVRAAADTGTHRIELYTEAYAQQYAINKEKSIANYIEAAAMANSLSIGLNAGHDLNLENLGYFAKNIPQLLEVSIGHALVCDALLYGMENTVQLYKRQLAATS
jgi:pyridoxine 5-phosphate synthase